MEHDEKPLLWHPTAPPLFLQGANMRAPGPLPIFRSEGKNEKMKKIMFGLAAAIAMVAAADIESSNVVGYQNIDVPQGYSMVTPTFKNMSGNTFKVSDIVPEGENISGDGDLSIQLMDDQGQWVGMYYWLTEDGWGAAADGWYTMEDEPCTAELDQGAALFVSCDNEGVSFRVAGEVSTVIANAVNQGYTMSGNSTPVAVNIKDIVPEGENISGDGDLSIQVMDADGQWIGMYYWLTEDGWGAVADGWYTMEDEAANFSLNPGESLFVSSDNEGVVLTIPSPLK